MLKKIANIGVFILLAMPVVAQQDGVDSTTSQSVMDDAGIEKTTNASGSRFDDTRILHRKEISGGILLHTMGFGVNLRFAKNRTWLSRRILQFEFVTIAHPKEIRIKNDRKADATEFVYGKLHSMGVLRGTYGRQRIVYSKETKRGVQIAFVYMGGFSLALLKPEYYEVYDENVKGIVNKRFDELEEPKHPNDIEGPASFFVGLDEMKFWPGIHARFGLNFEYAPLNPMLRFMEVGVNIEAYYKDVPIMANTMNDFYFITFYLNWQIGKKII